MERLSAIYARPDDDAPRLAYAEWLSELGAPRGEFIRLQCALARRLREGAAVAETKPLEQRIAKLWHRSAAGWLAAFDAATSRRWPPARDLLWTHRRGFLEALPQLFAAEEGIVARALAAAPLARALSLHFLSQDSDPLRRQLAAPGMSRIRSFNLRGGLRAESDAAAIVESPMWPRLTALRVLAMAYWTWGGVSISLDALSLLLHAPRAAPLETLALRGFDTGPRHAAAIAEAPSLGGLRVLDLDDTRIGAAGATALAESATLGALEQLSLRGVGLTLDAFTRLVNAPATRALRRLDVSRNPLRAAGVDALVRSPVAAGLSHLVITDAELDDDGVERIASAESLAGLVHLNLSGNRVTARGAQALASSTTLRSLAWVDFGRHRISIPARHSLSAGPAFAGAELSFGPYGPRRHRIDWPRG